MKHMYESLNSNRLIYISISLLLFIIVTFSCKVDVTSKFNDTQKVEQIISNFSNEIKAVNHEMQVGNKNVNGENSSVLRFKFDKVKVDIMNSTLRDRSREILKEIYVEVKDKEAFQEYEMLFFKDPEYKIEIIGENGSFTLNKIEHSFTKEELK